MTPDTEDAASATQGRLVSALLTLVFSVSAIGALLYFLGKSRVQSTQVMLGMPAGIIDSSPTAYAAAGVDVVLPFVVVGAIALLFVVAACHLVVRPALAKPSYDRAHRIVRRALLVTTVLALFGLGLVAIGILAQDAIGRPLGLVLPIVLVTSSGALAFQWAGPGRRVDSSSRLLFNLLICMAVAGVLWSGALYGDVVGRRFAEHFAANAAKQAEVKILSRDRLRVARPGMTVEELAHAGKTDYRYCYRGLRYLTKSDKFYIFVTAGWRVGDDLIYISTSTNIRFDTRRANSGTPQPALCSDL